jgi:AbrB family looped-hinge helix DNA binding protein
MSTSRVTSKGQVTLPVDIRRALSIEQGDYLVFEIAADRSVNARVVKRKRLSELYGALPATRPFPGTEAVRYEVGLILGEETRRKAGS